MPKITEIASTTGGVILIGLLAADVWAVQDLAKKSWLVAWILVVALSVACVLLSTRHSQRTQDLDSIADANGALVAKQDKARQDLAAANSRADRLETENEALRNRLAQVKPAPAASSPVPVLALRTHEPTEHMTLGPDTVVIYPVINSSDWTISNLKVTSRHPRVTATVGEYDSLQPLIHPEVDKPDMLLVDVRFLDGEEVPWEGLLTYTVSKRVSSEVRG